MNNPETNPKPEIEPQLKAGEGCPGTSCSVLLIHFDSRDALLEMLCHRQFDAFPVYDDDPEIKLSDDAKKAASWLFSKQAQNLTMIEARACILDAFGLKVERELKSFFRTNGEHVHPLTQDAENTMDVQTTTPPQQHAENELHGATCSALTDALGEALPQHVLACVSRLNLHDKPWSFDVTDDGRPLITRDSCQCSSKSMMHLRGLLPDGHPKGFSRNA
jgi:hypothetical protein